MYWELDPDLLDQDDPFEIDERNAPHLAKHPPFTEHDVLDAFFDNPVFVDAPRAPAIWIMIAEIPGEIVTIPLVPANSAKQVRPIGIYQASEPYREVYANAWR